MPARKTANKQSLRHLQEASANYRRYQDFLKEPQNVQWAIVFLFYSALHLVQAYACDKSPDLKLKDHEARDSYVARELRFVAKAYEKLKYASIDARYDLIVYDQVRALKFENDCFRPLRIHLREAGFFWDVPPTNSPAGEIG